CGGEFRAEVLDCTAEMAGADAALCQTLGEDQQELGVAHPLANPWMNNLHDYVRVPQSRMVRLPKQTRLERLLLEDQESALWRAAELLGEKLARHFGRCGIRHIGNVRKLFA